MTITQPLNETKLPIQAACCNSNFQNSTLQKTLDTICRIAIGVFAAVCAPMPFLISMQAGLIAGTAYTISRLYQNKSMLAEGENKPVCAQGYMDFLSGMKFPPPMGTLATATFIAAHTRHDPLFYAPFCGLFIGFWLGRQGAVLGKDLAGYAVNQLFPKAPPIPQKTCPCSIKK